MVSKLIWALALSCCMRKVVFFSGPPGNLGLQLSQCREVVCPGSRKSRTAESCAGLPGTWCVSHHHHHCRNELPTASLCSHPLFDLHKRSASVNECQCVHIEEFNDTRLLRMHFHVRHHFARLLLCCSHMATKLTNYWQEGSSSTAIPPASTSKVVGQHIKIGGINFGA
jgi:hypothetical protein